MSASCGGESREPEGTRGAVAQAALQPASVILPPDLVQELLSDAIEPDTPGLIRSVLTPSEMAELKALMPEASASAPIAAEPVLTSRESAALRAATMPAEQWVPVALVLPSDPFAWHVYRRPEHDEATRSAIWALREQQIKQRTGPIRARLEQLGAVGVEEFTVSPIVVARVRAGDIATVASWSDVEGIDLLTQPAEVLSSYYDGEQTRQGLRISELAADVDGSKGHWANATTRVRVGIIDKREMYVSAPGFRRQAGDVVDTLFAADANPAMNRFHFNCLVAGPNCLSNVFAADDKPSHATLVARVLLGTIENGQDPGFPLPAGIGARERSGVIPRSGVVGYHYGAGTTSDTSIEPYAVLKGLSTAVQNTVANDIINLSLSFPTNCTTPNNDALAATTLLQTALAFNALPVAAIGNSGPSGIARFPACRREVLAVAWLNTNNSQVYNQSIIAQGSSVGGLAVQTSNGSTGSLAVADLSAPGHWRYNYGPTPGGTPTYGFQDAGSSLAAPVVSGVAAMFRHGWSKHKPGVGLPAVDLLTHLLLLGDGYAHQEASQFKAVGFDNRSGAGRVHMHHPGSASLGAQWGWSDAISFTMTSGQAVRGFISTEALPASAKQVKVVMTWEEPGNGPYTQVANIVLSLVGNGILASDMSTDIRKRITVTSSNSALLSSSNLMWYVQAPSIPAGQSRRVHVAWYWHSSPNAGDH